MTIAEDEHQEEVDFRTAACLDLLSFVQNTHLECGSSVDCSREPGKKIDRYIVNYRQWLTELFTHSHCLDRWIGCNNKQSEQAQGNDEWKARASACGHHSAKVMGQGDPNSTGHGGPCAFETMFDWEHTHTRMSGGQSYVRTPIYTRGRLSVCSPGNICLSSSSSSNFWNINLERMNQPTSSSQPASSRPIHVHASTKQIGSRIYWILPWPRLQLHLPIL